MTKKSLSTLQDLNSSSQNDEEKESETKEISASSKPKNYLKSDSFNVFELINKEFDKRNQKEAKTKVRERGRPK